MFMVRNNFQLFVEEAQQQSKLSDNRSSVIVGVPPSYFNGVSTFRVNKIRRVAWWKDQEQADFPLNLRKINSDKLSWLDEKKRVRESIMCLSVPLFPPVLFSPSPLSPFFSLCLHNPTTAINYINLLGFFTTVPSYSPSSNLFPLPKYTFTPTNQ